MACSNLQQPPPPPLVSSRLSAQAGRRHPRQDMPEAVPRPLDRPAQLPHACGAPARRGAHLHLGQGGGLLQYGRNTNRRAGNADRRSAGSLTVGPAADGADRIERVTVELANKQTSKQADRNPVHTPPKTQVAPRFGLPLAYQHRWYLQHEGAGPVHVPKPKRPDLRNILHIPHRLRIAVGSLLC